MTGKSFGASPPGAACSQTVNTCQSGLCDTAIGGCTDTCQHDRDCRPQDACTLIIADFNGDGIDDLLDACMPRGVGGNNGDFCTANSDCLRGNCIGPPTGGKCADPCCSTTDCSSGYVCQPVQRANADGLVRACALTPSTGNAPMGSACSLSDNVPCRSTWCFADKSGAPPYCTDSCCTNADCPSGFRCISELFDITGDGVFDISQPICQRRQ